jgi:predicted helicase
MGVWTGIGSVFELFLTGLRDNLNNSITEADAISMLAQHLITKPVFDALFAGHDFAAHDPVSQVMQKMVDTLGDADNVALDRFLSSELEYGLQVASKR